MAHTGSIAPLTGDAPLLRAPDALNQSETGHGHGLTDDFTKSLKETEETMEGTQKPSENAAHKGKAKKPTSDGSEGLGDDEHSDGVDSKSDDSPVEDRQDELDAQIERLEAEQAGQPDKYKTTFDVMTRLCDENNRLRVEMGEEPQPFEMIIRGTPLEGLYGLYGKQTDRSARKVAKELERRKKQSSESDPA